MTAPSGKKTVGYILKKFPVLSETFILNEILELEAKGIPVHIFSLERPNDPRFHNDLPKLKARISYIPDVMDFKTLWEYPSKVKRINKKSYHKALAYVMKYGRPTLIWRFFQACYIADQSRRFKIGHFHAHFATRPSSVAFLASMLTDIPYSFTAHAMDIFKINLSKKALVKKIKTASFVVTVSDFNKKYLSDIAEEASEKIIKINNGIDLDRFKQATGAKTSPFKFITVARFVEKKGHPVLIEACERLHRKGVEFECWLIGKGKQRTLIKNLINEKKLKKQIKLIGPLSQIEVVSHYDMAHALVLPCIEGSDGNKDGLPVSIVEALACGIPVITTPMTGNPEVVENGYNGILVPFNDPDALADAMEKCIKDPEFYQNLCANSRTSVDQRFDIHQTIQQLANLFRGNLS